jgi:stage II sporulation protein R
MRRLMAGIMTAAVFVVAAYGFTKADFHLNIFNIFNKLDEFENERDRLEQAIASGDIIRLHVIADSDEPDAQLLKLAVRDALLDAFARRLSSVDANSARESIPELLPAMERVASDAARTGGFAGDVSVTFARESFPDREYAGMTLPAGSYDALIVRIGSASGRNWWCVMYPPLCLLTPDTLDAAQAAVQTQANQEQRGETQRAELVFSARLPEVGEYNIQTVRRSPSRPSILISNPDDAFTDHTDRLKCKPLFKSVVLEWLREIFG